MEEQTIKWLEVLIFNEYDIKLTELLVVECTYTNY
jgi:hypothetical protein